MPTGDENATYAVPQGERARHVCAYVVSLQLVLASDLRCKTVFARQAIVDDLDFGIIFIGQLLIIAYN
jgi:hypothetical protein